MRRLAADPLLKIMTDGSASHRVRELLREIMGGYCDEVEKEYSTRSNGKYKVKKAREFERDLHWTVLAQTGVGSYLSLATANNKSASTVHRAVQAMIERIGLIRNPALKSRGRKRGSKNSESTKVRRRLGRQLILRDAVTFFLVIAKRIR